MWYITLVISYIVHDEQNSSLFGVIQICISTKKKLCGFSKHFDSPRCEKQSSPIILLQTSCNVLVLQEDPDWSPKRKYGRVWWWWNIVSKVTDEAQCFQKFQTFFLLWLSIASCLTLKIRFLAFFMYLSSNGGLAKSKQYLNSFSLS